MFVNCTLGLTCFAFAIYLIGNVMVKISRELSGVSLGECGRFLSLAEVQRERVLKEEKG
jgi:hypothetical protein